MRELQTMLQSPAAFFIFVVTILTSLMAENPTSPVKDKFIFNPVRVWHHREWHRVITSGLIHQGFFHLFLNMLTFFYSAFMLEKMMGSVSFAILYLGSLILSHLPDLWVYRNNSYYNALGASGAVSGVLFGLSLYAISFFPHSKILLFFALPIPVWLFPPVFIAFSLLADRYANDRVGHRAHLAGAIAGAAITLLLSPDLIYYVWDGLKNASWR